ncbi:MAG: rhodanese-like domain-containing protein [Isosphaerales bacterium]
MSVQVASSGSTATISPRELAALICQGRIVELIDVRTPAEYREVHAEPAGLAPLDSLDPRVVMESRSGAVDEPLYVICRTGSRGRMACEKFVAAGYRNVINVEGGTQAWEQAGLAVVRGKKTIALERQVRIAAGSLVLLGTALGAFVHPAFLVLSAFIGAGLVFAGITDTCGMAMLLARMPWNRAGGEAANCER